LSASRNDGILVGLSTSARDRSEVQTVDCSSLSTFIRERREALGLPQSRLARFSGLSRQRLAVHRQGLWV
jgi:hypothetical protein